MDNWDATVVRLLTTQRHTEDIARGEVARRLATGPGGTPPRDRLARALAALAARLAPAQSARPRRPPAGEECAEYGIAVDYEPGAGGRPDPLVRAACHAALVRQPGYRRRLALMADGWRRVVDLFLFADPDAARAAPAGDDRR